MHIAAFLPKPGCPDSENDKNTELFRSSKTVVKGDKHFLILFIG